MSRAGWPEKCPGVVCSCSFVDTVSLSPLTKTEVAEIRRRWTEHAALLEALEAADILADWAGYREVLPRETATYRAARAKVQL